MEDDRKTDIFLDDVNKKMVSNKIRQRNREEKIQYELTVPFNLSLITEIFLRIIKSKVAQKSFSQKIINQD